MIVEETKAGHNQPHLSPKNPGPKLSQLKNPIQAVLKPMLLKDSQRLSSDHHPKARP